jgi:hypothetical protein
MGGGLCAAPDGVRELMGQSLRALVPVLQSLTGVIANHCNIRKETSVHDSHLA